MVKGSGFYVEASDGIECTMTITLTLKQWKLVRDSLRENQLSGWLSADIASMVDQMTQVMIP